MGQMTIPTELPISGSVEAGEIELKIESETHRHFRIENKRLALVRPLDRDAVLREVSFAQPPPAAHAHEESASTPRLFWPHLRPNRQLT